MRVVVGAVLVVLLAACGGPDSSSPAPGPSPAPADSGPSSSAPSSPPPSSPPPSSAAVTGSPEGRYYLSVGDSYAAGYLATGPREGRTTRAGFAYRVVDLARAAGSDYELVNLGCSGATTASVLETAGCEPERLGPGAASYDEQTQAEAAEAFLRGHRGEVGLITVSLGGNDVIACGLDEDPVSCVGETITEVGANLDTLLRRLREAAPDALIVGTTYPDTLLAALLTDDPAARGIGTLSVTAFQSLINPRLRTAYEAVGGVFADVTAASGAYGPLTETTRLAPYGEIPVPVARVCRLTAACEFQDFHPTRAGYALIARLVVAAAGLD